MLLCFFLDLSYGSKPVLLKIVFLSLFGALIEITQYFVPYRSWSFVDFAVDVTGILIYFSLTRWFGRRLLRPLLLNALILYLRERSHF
jgi:VanZ family protein